MSDLAMRIELASTTRVLLEEIAHPSTGRNDIASTYGLAIRSSAQTDWTAVNAAIIERWSISALIYIKSRAWKMLKEKADE